MFSLSLSVQINGVNTQGENIADNGGLHESFRAYVRSVESEGEDPQLPGLEQYSNEQLFFISYSQVNIIINGIKYILPNIRYAPLRNK